MEEVYTQGGLQPRPQYEKHLVIADDKVAALYTKYLDQLGVEVSRSKSLVSPLGAVEFAKRFRIRNMTRDVSPLSIRKQVAAASPIGWYYFCLTHDRPLRLSLCSNCG